MLRRGLESLRRIGQNIFITSSDPLVVSQHHNTHKAIHSPNVHQRAKAIFLSDINPVKKIELFFSLRHVSFKINIPYTSHPQPDKLMKYSLLPLSVACVIGSALGNLCDFVLDGDSLQSSVFDTSTPSLVAFTKDEDENNPVTSQLMEASLTSLGHLGFCVATFDCSQSKHAKLCSITAGHYPFLSLYLGEPKKNPYTKKVSLINVSSL